MKDASTGNPITTPIHMDKNTDMGIVNEVPSIQGRRNTDVLVNNSNVRFADNKRINDVLSGSGLQLPNLKESANPFINYNIQKSVNNVNAVTDYKKVNIPNATKCDSSFDSKFTFTEFNVGLAINDWKYTSAAT